MVGFNIPTEGSYLGERSDTIGTAGESELNENEHPPILLTEPRRRRKKSETITFSFESVIALKG